MKKTNYLIYGLAKSGKAAFELLYNKKDVFYLYDEDDEKRKFFIKNYSCQQNVFVLKSVDKTIIDSVDKIILSPGFSIYLPTLQYAKTKGVEIISELELGFRFSKNKIIAITGTNGKTTTVSLLDNIFKYAHKNSQVVGNIGYPISSFVKKNKKTVLICEVSSFQLETIKDFKPNYAGILNLTPDHINRHKSFKNYKRTKFKIFKNLTKNNKIVLNENIKFENKNNLKVYTFGFNECKNGCFVKENKFYFANNNKIEEICDISLTKLVGKHNLENIMACICFAKFFKIKNKYIIKALQNFKPISHRIEKVYEINNICFYDDSKSTNIDSTLKAIQSFKKETFLILGGSDKGFNFDDIFKNLNKTITKIFACGEVSSKIVESAKKFNYVVNSYKTLRDATFAACNLLKPNQNLLLSPATASFDEFKNYKDRGEKFLIYVKEFYEK